VNPAEIFLAGLRKNTSYYIPIILDYIKPNDNRKTGHHFRIPFVGENGYITVSEVPVELLNVFLPARRVLYDGEFVKPEGLGEEREISFWLSRSDNVPRKVSQFSTLSAYFKKELKEFLHKEVDRQWVIKVYAGEEIYYFPSTVLGAFFYYLSHKFTTNLFLASLSREVIDYGTNPPFIQLKPGYSNQYREVVSLYLYSTNAEAKTNYDEIGRRHIAKQAYGRKESKSSLRYAFKCSFPVSGEWELKARVVPIADKTFLVAEILYVNTIKLLNTESIELRVLGRGKRKRIVFPSPTAVKSKTKKIYDSTEYADSKESPETVQFPFTSPPANKSVKIVRKNVGGEELFSFIPVPKQGDDEKVLSNVEDYSQEGTAKKVRATQRERATRDIENRVFDLETVKKLMNQVAKALGVKMDYREFVPKISIKVPKSERFKLYYPDGNKRKVGIFLFDLPSGKKVTAIFPDQKLQKEFTTSPVIVGDRKLKFPDEVVFFYKMFQELNRNAFRRFCGKRGFEVYFKKPLQGSSRKDWENWVERMVYILERG